jgi:hypothetical protein
MERALISPADVRPHFLTAIQPLPLRLTGARVLNTPAIDERRV